MKNIITILAVWLCCIGATAQVRSQMTAFPGGKYQIYRVALQDKRGCKASLKHPDKFLSEKSLRRRAKQHLLVDSTDLPLSRTYLKKMAEQGFAIIGGSKWNNTVLVKDTCASASQRLCALPFVTSVVKVLEESTP